MVLNPERLQQLLMRGDACAPANQFDETALEHLRMPTSLSKQRGGEQTRQRGANDDCAHPSRAHTSDRPIDAPPSTNSVCPVMNDASSDSKNAIAAAISSGRPNRPMGTIAK